MPRSTKQLTGAQIASLLEALSGSDKLDHDALNGLTDDDHTQYHNATRANAWLATKDTDNLAESATNTYLKSNARQIISGYVDSQRGNSRITWDDTTKIMTLTHSSDYSVYVAGTEVQITGDKTIDISATIAEGWWYFYLNSSGTLLASQSFPDLNVYAICAAIYWDATNSQSKAVQEERHGLIMDSKTHAALHYAIGTRWRSGLAGTSSVVAQPTAPSNDTSSKLWFTGGTIADEDLLTTVVSDSAPTNDFEQILGANLTDNAALLPVWYRDGSGVWRVWDNDTDRFAFYHNGGNTLPYWNEYSGGAWGLTAAVNLDFVVYWVCAAPFLASPVFLVMHSANFGTFEEAKEVDISDIEWLSTPFPEIVVLYRCIYECRTAYTNATHRTVLREALDLRSTTAASVVGVPTFDENAADNWLTTKTTGDLAETTDARYMSDTQESKLDGIETGADVTDATNVAAAGALMAGTATTADVPDSTDARYMSDAQESKLDILSEVSSNLRIGANVGINEDPTATEALRVTGDVAVTSGDVEIVPTTTGSVECLSETDFATHVNWSVTGDFDVSGGNAAYTHSTGTGTLTQDYTAMASPVVGGEYYILTYDVIGATGTIAASVGPSAFTTGSPPLDLTSGTGRQTVFKAGSSAASANLVITATSSAGGAFTLDNISLKRVVGGSLDVLGPIYGDGIWSRAGNSVIGIRPLASGGTNIWLSVEDVLGNRKSLYINRLQTNEPNSAVGGLFVSLSSANNSETIFRLADVAYGGRVHYKTAIGISSALSGATATITLTTAIPAGAIITEVLLKVKTLVTSGDGGTDFNAALSGGATDAIGSAIAFAKNTEANKSFVGVETTGATDVTLTCAASGVAGGETFSGGEVVAVVFYRYIADGLNDFA